MKTRVHRARSFLRALFALAATKVVLTGGVGRMLEMARSNLRNIPSAASGPLRSAPARPFLPRGNRAN
jgi:hypothetical protein